MCRITHTRQIMRELLSDVSADRVDGTAFYRRLKAVEHSIITLLAEARGNEILAVQSLARELRDCVDER